MKPWKLACSAIALFLVGMLLTAGFYDRAVPAAAQLGSSGEQVKQIQQKLKELGYDVGTPDGVFGSKTQSAVKAFQRDNGLTADGVVGTKTLTALGLSGSGSGSGSGSSGGATAESLDLDLLSRIISAEAKGEPYEGQVAVGAVILNRIEHPSFPNTLAGVIYQGGAFESVSNGEFNKAATESCVRAAREAIAGSDPSGGAIYYFNPKTATNKWIWSRPAITTIGNHRFCL